MLKNGNIFCNTSDLLMDFRTALNPKIYPEITENSLHYSIPFQFLSEFVNYKKNSNFFTITEWETGNTKLVLKKYHPIKIDETIRQIENYLNNLSKNKNL